jgi:hypothetical protein
MKLLQEEEMKVNVRKETQLANDVTGAWLELDIWFPHLHLAFEYQVSFYLSLSLFLSLFSLLMKNLILMT